MTQTKTSGHQTNTPQTNLTSACMHSFLPSVDAEFKSIPNPVHVPSRFELPKRQQRRTMALTGTGTGSGSGTVFFLLLSIISPKLLIRFRWHFSRLFISITCTFWPNYSSVGRLLYDLESNDTRPTHPRQSRAEPCFTASHKHLTVSHSGMYIFETAHPILMTLSTFV